MWCIFIGLYVSSHCGLLDNFKVTVPNSFSYDFLMMAFRPPHFFIIDSGCILNSQGHNSVLYIFFLIFLNPQVLKLFLIHLVNFHQSFILKTVFNYYVQWLDAITCIVHLTQLNAYHMLHFYAPYSCVHLYLLFCYVHYKPARQSLGNSWEKSVSPWTFLNNFQWIYTYFKI